MKGNAMHLALLRQRRGIKAISRVYRYGAERVLLMGKHLIKTKRLQAEHAVLAAGNADSNRIAGLDQGKIVVRFTDAAQGIFHDLSSFQGSVLL